MPKVTPQKAVPTQAQVLPPAGLERDTEPRVDPDTVFLVVIGVYQCEPHLHTQPWDFCLLSGSPSKVTENRQMFPRVY